ncbi:hypothetical protein SAMN04488104_100744 [Algoriphagus faecimaris]|uniref:Uncharacterized protein n=1 Tax=Algoriphagus faecimaris TaxID=686796 RepID=A0A1G6PVR2_9BACT|nr:hypothetical protein SAMN04488104_100744 [Algoriphagus faecimaris]
MEEKQDGDVDSFRSPVQTVSETLTGAEID